MEDGILYVLFFAVPDYCAMESYHTKEHNHLCFDQIQVETFLSQ